MYGFKYLNIFFFLTIIDNIEDMLISYISQFYQNLEVIVPKEIIIPYDNLKDLEDIPEDIKKDIHYIPVKTYKEVLKYILDNK